MCILYIHQRLSNTNASERIDDAGTERIYEILQEKYFQITDALDIFYVHIFYVIHILRNTYLLLIILRLRIFTA